MSQPSLSSSNLRWFSKFLCFATFFLIFAGSLVTSTSSGLAVPDWPLSYGMLFPPMVGGVFYEHGHRLVAATVGFLTLLMFFWVWRVEKRKWVKRLASLALLAVILQGSLGGITVLFFLPTAVSMSHAILGQTFFLLTLFLAYTFSIEFQERQQTQTVTGSKTFFKVALVFLFTVYVQLFLGAMMRHTGSGLAVPDFPLMAGKVLPSLDQNMVNWINAWRFERGLDDINLNQVLMHLAHRCGAILVFCASLWMTVKAKKIVKTQKALWYLVLTIDAMVLLQILLGAIAIWTEKAPYFTSFHVLLGAGILGLSALLMLRSYPFAKKNT